VPSPTHHPNTRRRIILIVAVVALAAGSYGCYRLGGFLFSEDALQRADAICVLAGTRMERPLEAADLYLEGWAKHILLTEEMPDNGIVTLERRGLEFPTTAEIARDVIVRIGVPPSAVEIIPQIHDNTAHEANTFRRVATARGWKRLIVVTSKYHTRRAGFAVRRELSGTGIEVIIRGTRYDRANPDHWWRTRGDVRYATSEAQKLVVYMLGLGM
jgi:uncharacterized SAM-binding protein YcdF (DUF218 family)